MVDARRSFDSFSDDQYIPEIGIIRDVCYAWSRRFGCNNEI